MTSTPDPPRAELRWPILLVLVGAFLMRLWHLGARTLWLDEAMVWTAASSSFPELVRLCAQKDASPPLFHLLTSFLLRVGDSEGHVRAVSLLASVGLVWLTYRLARLMVPRGEATLAAAICALSPFQLMYGQEARTYTLVAFLSVASFYLFVRAVLFDRPRAWLPYLLVSALALYTQNIALLGFGVQAVLVVFTTAGRRGMLRWILAQAGVVLLYLPWFFVSLAQTERLDMSHWYLETPGGHEVFQVLRAILLSPIPLVSSGAGAPHPGLDAYLPRRLAHLVLLLLPVVPLLLSLPSALGRNQRATVSRVVWAALVLPPLVVWLVSFQRPLWLPRYFVFATPFMAVLLARGMSSLRPALLERVWEFVFLAVSAYACWRYDTDYTKEPWREAVQRVTSASVPGHSAALVLFDADAFRYYTRHAPYPVIEVSHPDVPFASGYTDAQLDVMEAGARTASAPYDDLWIVIRDPSSPTRQDLVRRVEAMAAHRRAEVERYRLDSTGGPLRIVHFRGATADSAALAAEPAPSTVR